MLSEMSKPAFLIIKELNNYFGLKDYFSYHYYSAFQPEKVRNIHAYSKDNQKSGEEYFWNEVLTGRILDGYKIQLHDFQISPWFPRRPGLYWTYDAARARKLAEERHVERYDHHSTHTMMVFDVYGKTLMSEVGGVGCVKFRKNRDEVLVTATASGKTERGIPIICTKNIWSEIDQFFQKERMLEVDLVGTVVPFPTGYDSFFFNSPDVPKVAVKIESLLNIQMKVSRLNIVVTPWTLFESSDEYKPYGFTYITHDIIKDDLKKSISWMQDYVEEKKGKVILTDFDEETNSLNAKFPLNSCADGAILNSDIMQYCQEIHSKFK